MVFTKKAAFSSATGEDDTRETVNKMLKRVEAGGEQAVAELAKELDGYNGPIMLSKEEWDAGAALCSPQAKHDIEYAHANVKLFAQKQLESIHEFETELSPGIFAGQKVVPVETAGCYVPGGRYAHIASAVMSITTARVAGVPNVIMTSPPRPSGGIAPEILYAAKVAGADHVLCCGGVQGIAALRYGCFTGCPADILVGPGNKYVAEAKRILYGGVGIDMFAGPTEILIIADDSADVEVVATDLVSQAEHGINSPAWLITTSERLAKEVAERMHELIALLPDGNRQAAEASWRDFGEIQLFKTREEAVKASDLYAAEHLEVHCEDLSWWHQNLRNYGSLFIGEETCVSHGDKCSGPNHVLPTKGASRYSGGLSVHKFVKILSFQRMTREANRTLAPICARISRAEGMEAHARSADARLAKYFKGAERLKLLNSANAPAGHAHLSKL
eukprot:gnl/MRDRNA2_/MRDRNA2_78224_c0_seq2.p1 gnl/MRDRNA2_/MRDRNA2_78224_c0~~gnl/MRDRNA2_/MRDRNA2_78224_c0_seq2.p1  ORF type:complete len:447 (+),score=111.26 gnl/MRDRNA2_/MRDRNA2_78224_c0_seq2:75-1415(+)